MSVEVQDDASGGWKMRCRAPVCSRIRAASSVPLGSAAEAHLVSSEGARGQKCDLPESMLPRNGHLCCSEEDSHSHVSSHQPRL